MIAFNERVVFGALLTTAVIYFMMAVMEKKKTKAALKCLEVLSTSFHYKREEFDRRTQFLSIPQVTGADLNAFYFEAFRGAPFALFVTTESAGFESDLLDSAKAYVADSETIGLLVLFEEVSETFRIYRRRFRDNEFDVVSELEHYFRGQVGNKAKLLEASAPYDSPRDSSAGHLVPITNKLENLFFEIHSAMRDVDGLHSDSALEELCKIIYLKCYIEEQEKKLPIKGVATPSFGTTEEYAAVLRALYRDAINYDLRVFGLKIPEYKRSRGVFEQPIFLSSSALVRAFQLIEDFSLTQTGADLKGRAFQKVLNKSIRAGMGQYFTPSEVCRLIVHVLSPTASDLILDPFCGSGHFLTECLGYVKGEEGSNSKEFHEFAFGKLHGIEKSDRMTRIAMTDMRLGGDGHSNIRCTDALLDFRNYPDIRAESFDMVMTNPPFGSILGQDAFQSLAKFKLAEGRKKVPLEVVGLERSIEFLRPGGRLAIVLPEGIFNAQSTMYVREWLSRRVVVKAIVDLPSEAFAPFGANVRSGILIARKLLPGEVPDADDSKVLMIKIENLGYDASGRAVDGSDISEVTSTIKSHLDREGW